MDTCIEAIIAFNSANEKGETIITYDLTEFMLDIFKLLMILFSPVIDQIIGCGMRNGKKYFLVRFKGERQNEIIDWEAAKKYSVEVMEYFGSRLVWAPIENVIDPERGDNLNENADENQNENDTENMTFTSKSNNLPNEIEYAD